MDLSGGLDGDGCARYFYIVSEPHIGTKHGEFAYLTGISTTANCPDLIRRASERWHFVAWGGQADGLMFKLIFAEADLYSWSSRQTGIGL